MSSNQFEFMGIINITPDSFSDGGKNFSSVSILKNIDIHIKNGAKFLDFGAESTAPFNDAIGFEEELSRFRKHLYPILKKICAYDISISIDTYRPDTFREVASEILKHDSSKRIIWNDVSGIVDDKTNQILSDFPSIHYVIAHNLSPNRESTSAHMDFVNKSLSIDDIKEYFHERISRVSSQQILLDPCFGFSKTTEQNWMLIREWPKLVREFEQSWLLGISKKSFLKTKVEEVTAEDLESYSENLQAIVIKYWLDGTAHRTDIIRIHDVAAGQLSVLGQQILT